MLFITANEVIVENYVCLNANEQNKTAVRTFIQYLRRLE